MKYFKTKIVFNKNTVENTGLEVSNSKLHGSEHAIQSPKAHNQHLMVLDIYFSNPKYQSGVPIDTKRY